MFKNYKIENFSGFEIEQIKKIIDKQIVILTLSQTSEFQKIENAILIGFMIYSHL